MDLVTTLVKGYDNSPQNLKYEDRVKSRVEIKKHYMLCFMNMGAVLVPVWMRIKNYAIFNN